VGEERSGLEGGKLRKKQNESSALLLLRERERGKILQRRRDSKGNHLKKFA